MSDDTAAAITKGGTNGSGGAEFRFVFDPTVFDRETPDYLIPKMDQYPVSDPAYYKQLVVLDPRAAPPDATELDTALDPFAPLDELPAPDRPLQGVLFTYEQAWRQTGLALGRLVHSLCLAPGEVTKIAVMDFTRRTTGTTSESASQGEAVASTTDQGSAVQEVRESVAEEAQRGTSSQSSVTNQSQAGVSGGGIFVSGSASTSQSTGFGVSTASSASSARLRADGSRQMQQNTIAKSQAVRSRRATQVREVSESETQTATTRVIANYNHMHALTMMFFEVVQIFELSTRAVDAERVLFIPMKALAFDEEAVRAQSSRLVQVLRAHGMNHHVDQLYAFLRSDTAPVRLAVTIAEALLRERVNDLIAKFPKAKNEEIGLNPPDGYQIQRLFAGFDFQLQHAIEDDGRDKVMGERGVPEAIEARRKAEEAYRAYVKATHDLEAALDIVRFFDLNRLWFNQQLWLAMTPGHIQRLVAKRTFDGTPLAHLMDPRPLGVHGNYVAFRLPHRTAGGDAAFANRYVQQPGDREIPQDFIALPSGGVFGEAVLGEAIAAEKIDLTRFWNWQDSPIPILPPSMQPLDLASRARGIDFSRVDLDAALTELLKPAIQESIDLDGIIGEIKSSFRDMSGSAEVQALLAAQTAATQAGAEAAGAQAVQTGKNIQDFTVGLANSELAKAAVSAVAARKGAGATATVLGGVLGGSKADGPAKAGNGAAGEGD